LRLLAVGTRFDLAQDIRNAYLSCIFVYQRIIVVHLNKLTFFSLLWVCLSKGHLLHGQSPNLVPNPSFEEYQQCPPTISMFYLANGWTPPSQGTTDFYHRCSQGNVGIPENLLGYQLPHTGDGYAGLIPYSPFSLYREYAQVKLTQALVRNVVYHVEYFVNHSNVPGAFVSNLDASFSKEPARQGIYQYGLLDNVTRPPQITNRSGLLKDTLNWIKIEGNFVAEGGEQYLTIGNFLDNHQTEVAGEPFDAYYYLDDVSVTVAACPVVNNLGADLMLCPGDTKRLDATFPDASYRWQDGSTGSAFLVQGPGIYWVDVQLADCFLRDSIRVQYLDRFPDDLLRDTTLCYTREIKLDASFPGAVSYRWQDGSRQATFTVYGSGLYWVDVNFGGCTYRDSVRVRFLDDSSILSGFYTLCEGKPVLLDATLKGATAYRWQDGSTNPTFLATSPGYYSVGIQYGDCWTYHYTQVDYANPQLFTNRNFSICPGQAFLLDASSGQEPYRWQDGSTGNLFQVDQPGKYWVEYSWYGCRFRDSVTVTSYPAPPRALPSVLTLCRGETRVLDASSLGSIHYLWQDGSFSPSFTVDKPGKYWVEYLWYECFHRDSVQVNYFDDFPHPLPSVVSLCPGETQVLDVSSVKGSYYHWQDGSSQPTLSVSQPGKYWVEFPWQDCRVRDSTVVTLLSKPELWIEIDTVFCYGRSVRLRARGNNQSFTWSDGSQGPELIVRQPGTYWVDGWDKATGCVKRQTIELEPTECWANLVIPNVFTPNGDAFNQHFVIEGLTDHWSLEITDRWGRSVYHSPSYANNWDAAGLASGLYYYYLSNFISGQKYRGWLQVLY